MEVEVDWDLHAVVRGCCTTTTTNNNPKQQQQPRHQPSADNNKVNALGQFFHHESNLNHLDSTPPHVVPSPALLQPQPDQIFDLFRPFIFSPFPSTTTPATQTNETPSISSCSSLLHHRNTLTPIPRSKRRKNQFKKVCEVPAEGLASDDKWSWRKYGQKPIKGSPYPRGYYRCSSSKGCPARKQVERSRTDPKMFIVTYTSEHNHPAPTHRNSLAGVSRHQNHSKTNVLPIGKAGSSSSSVPTSPSDNDDDDMQQSLVKTENEYQLDEILLHQVEGGGNDMKEEFLDDDFFEGLDEIAERQVDGGSMS